MTGSPPGLDPEDLAEDLDASFEARAVVTSLGPEAGVERLDKALAAALPELSRASS